jgi:hypothetical protein
MDLDDVIGVAVIGKDRRLEGDAAKGSIAAPFAETFAALARADAQIVECVVPATILGKSGGLRVKVVGLYPTDGVTFRLVEVETDAGQRGAYDMAQIVWRNADALAGFFQYL